MLIVFLGACLFSLNAIVHHLLQMFNLYYCYLLLEPTPRGYKVHCFPVFLSFTFFFPEVGNQWKVDTQVCFKIHSHGSFQSTHLHYPIIIIMTWWIREVDIIIPLLLVRKKWYTIMFYIPHPTFLMLCLPKMPKGVSGTVHMSRINASKSTKAF